MGFSASNFITAMLAVMISGVVLGASLSIFGSIEIPEGMANAGVIGDLINLIPILLAIGLILGAVYLFVARK